MSYYDKTIQETTAALDAALADMTEAEEQLAHFAAHLAAQFATPERPGPWLCSQSDSYADVHQAHEQSRQ